MDTLKPGWINPKKPPAGVAQFNEKGKNGVMVWQGNLYSYSGEPLPLDVAWLRQNNYMCNQDVIRLLKPPAPKKTEKPCHACATALPVEARYCHQCAAPQNMQPALWTPGSGGEGDRIAALIDPEDPLGSLAALEEGPPVLPERVTAEQMGPTVQDALAGLSQHINPMARIQAVPGEAPTALHPSLEMKPAGEVAFEKPQKSRGRVRGV